VKRLSHISSFLRTVGVCPIPITDLVPSLPSRNTVPAANQMSQDMFGRLSHFFRPFNHLLTTLTGLNTTQWDDKTPPLKLPKYSPLNKTMPDLWFQVKEAAAVKKAHFLPQLLPQRYVPTIQRTASPCSLHGINVLLCVLQDCRRKERLQHHTRNAQLLLSASDPALPVRSYLCYYNFIRNFCVRAPSGAPLLRASQQKWVLPVEDGVVYVRDEITQSMH
jgi:hypothetical protein